MLFYSAYGVPFGLVSVDLAEYSDVFHGSPALVPFVGYRHDGSAVTNVLTTAGLYDQFFVPLFQTFYFPADFNGFDRVEIPNPYLNWSLDNLVLSVPEPCAPALLALGSAIYAMRRHRRIAAKRT